MKRLLQLGFLLGFALTAAAGYFLPWIGYQRYPSATIAVMNGGRGEQFLIRLPNDRIHSGLNVPGTPHTGPVHDAFPSAAGLDTLAPTAIEHYKLRDISGNVIGVATHHSTMASAGSASAWMLSIPSRGMIAFGGAGQNVDRIERALAGEGWVAGRAFVGELTVPVAAGMVSAYATREFAGIGFTLDETWDVTSVDDDGRLHGTIQLVTVGRGQQ